LLGYNFLLQFSFLIKLGMSDNVPSVSDVACPEHYLPSLFYLGLACCLRLIAAAILLIANSLPKSHVP